jgi:uncharacterized protein YegL
MIRMQGENILRSHKRKREERHMKKDLTEMVFILDRSGSMHGLEKDTVGGFNAMIEEQKGKEGEVLISTVLFNGSSTVLHDRVPIREVREMTNRDYRTSGCTALLDAIGDAVRHIRNVHKYIRQEDVPAHTMFVITTDGMENTSREYTAQEVRSMIREQEEQKGWEFLFLGANIDAAAEAAKIGISRDRSADYSATACGTSALFTAVNESVSSVRRKGVLCADWKKDLK